MASRREPAVRMAVAVAGRRRGPRVASAMAWGSRSPAWAATPWLQSMRRIMASGAAHSVATSAQPLGSGGGPEGLAEVAEDALQRDRFVGREIEGAEGGDGEVLRGAEFCQGFPGILKVEEGDAGGAEVATGVAEDALDGADGGFGGDVGDEVLDELGGEVAGGGGVVGEELEGFDAAGFTGGDVGAEKGFGAGLVGLGAEDVAGVHAVEFDGPAGEDLGELGDVGLGVAARGAEGVELEALAGEVFVQAAFLGFAGLAVGADGIVVVEIHEHCGVAHDGEEHGEEGAGDVGADGLADVGADDGGGAALAGADGEVVGPKPDEALAEGGGGGEELLGLGLHVRLVGGGDDAGGEVEAIGFTEQGEAVGGGGELRVEDGDVVRFDLLLEPADGFGWERLFAFAA